MNIRRLVLITAFIGMAAHAIDLYDEEFPWKPVTKHDALFYSVVWAGVGCGFIKGIYDIIASMEKPTSVQGVVADAARLMLIGLCARVVQYAGKESREGMKILQS